MISSKTLFLAIVAIVSVVHAQVDEERFLKKILEPKKGKLCKIKTKTKVKNIKYGDGNARKCADDCLADKKCKGMQYLDHKNRCTLIYDAMNYKMDDAKTQVDNSFCGKVYVTDGPVADPSTKYAYYDCKDQTLCKDIVAKKAIKIGDATTASKCAYACGKTVNCRSFQFDGSKKECTVLQYRTRSVYNVLPTSPTSVCCKAPK